MMALGAQGEDTMPLRSDRLRLAIALLFPSKCVENALVAAPDQNERCSYRENRGATLLAAGVFWRASNDRRYLAPWAYRLLRKPARALSSFASATIALACTTGAYTSEIIRAGLDAVPHGQKEAAAAIGLSGLDALRFVILPQGLRVSVPPLFSFSILMLQASSLCFAIALPELVSQAYVIGSNTFRYMSILVLAGLLYAVICIPANIVVSALERGLGRHAA
jgi:ABC-type amino acid transport system permease subunit